MDILFYMQRVGGKILQRPEFMRSFFEPEKQVCIDLDMAYVSEYSRFRLVLVH